MKKQIQIFFIISALALISFSCAKEYEFFLEEFYIAFNTDTLRVNEGGRANVGVTMAAPKQDKDIIVDLELSSPDGLVEGVDYTLLEPADKKIVFVQGEEQEAIVRLQTTRSYNYTGDQLIKVTLTNSNSDLLLGAPGPDQRAKTLNVVLFDLDCPWEFDNFFGEATIRDSALVGSNVKTYASTVEEHDTDDNKLVVTGLWRWKVEDDQDIYDIISVAQVEVIVEESEDGRTLLTVPNQLYFVHPDIGEIWIEEYYLTPEHKTGLNTCSGEALVGYRIYRKSTGTNVDRIYSTWRF